MEEIFSNKRKRRSKAPEPKLTWLIYLIATIVLMETLFRYNTLGLILSPGIIFSFLFAIPLAAILYILTTIFSKKVNYILSSLTLFLLGLLFASQLIYYKIFKTFYTSYSASNAGQVLQFWSEVLTSIRTNALSIMLLFMPFILFLFIGQKITSEVKLKANHIFISLAVALLIHMISLGAIRLGGKDENSAFNLYYNIHYPNFSVSNLGLITYMRVDFQRHICGWSPRFIGELPNLDEEDDFKDEDEKPIEYNIMDIDFDTLISNETNPEIKQMHEYFKSLKATEKNQYTGIYKDYNFILITAEGFSHLAVNKDVTPTLYKMVHEGYYFKDFYTPIWGVSTSDGEYVANTGLIPKSGVWSFRESSKIYLPFVMGNQFKKLGYSARAYHNHTYTFYDRHLSHPNMGYDYKGLGNGLNVRPTWPESDLEMMELTIPEFIGDSQFHVNYMTVSGHMLYTFSGNYMSYKNKKYVEDLPYSDSAKAYLAAQIELDRALEYLLNKLDEAGLAEKTLIALSADHYPYGLELEEMEELAGKKIEENFELYRNAFILYTKGMEPVVIDKPVSSLDIIPTVSNLLGLEFDSRLLMGVDAFSNAEPLIIFSNRSFITEKGRYNSKSKTYIPNKGFEDDENYRKNISNIVNAKFFYSAKILETDYYSKVIKK